MVDMRSPTQQEVHQLAVQKGWHENHALLIAFLQTHGAPAALVRHARACWVATRVALIHSEASEALALVRADHDEVGSQEWADELADIALRVKDLAADTDVDLETAQYMKHAKNRAREYRHGGKTI